MSPLSCRGGWRQPHSRTCSAAVGAPTQGGSLRSLALIAAVLASACSYTITQPVLGYENSDLACSDDIDNDGDGVVDCQDPDCWPWSTWCGEVVPPWSDDRPSEDSYALCTDLIDNDGDGQLDCSERSCQTIAETCCVQEMDDVSCSDHLDNDANGFADCEDYGCSNGKFVTVCDEFSDEACDDNKDNDADGEEDCDDPDCIGTEPCPGEPENTEARCRDDEDNDGNGYTDCVDRACEGFSFCQNPDTEESMDDCTDGEDNNDNGYVDCEDFSCQRSVDAEVAAMCGEILENTFEKCTDNIDNDGNNYPDCEDYSCRNSRDPRVAVACQESVSVCEFATVLVCTVDGDCTNPDARSCLTSGFCGTRGGRCGANEDCSDGDAQTTDSCFGADHCSDNLDNDGDGFLDCQDFDCAWDPSVTACEGEPRVCE